MEILSAITGGVSGVSGICLGWLGLKSRLKRIDDQLDTITKNVRFEATCDAIREGIQRQLEQIQESQKETRDDLKQLLKQIKIK